MEENWLEIKRFLNDYKRNIFIGSAIIAILFTVSIYLIGTLKGEDQLEEQEDYEVESEELLNDAQPAYFQIYIEYEDGTAYGNASIINQYFNLNSTKEKIKQDTRINIKSIEDEISFSDMSDKIKIIHVTRNDSSYLMTATFNLGNEQDNLIVAKYYFNLLYSEDFSILADKKMYIFQEPMLAEKKKVNMDLKKLEEQRKEGDEYSSVKEALIQFKNITIGFFLGIVIMIGLFLLKAIFGKTLDYSFAYDLEENDKFILYDKLLKNEDLVCQFIAVPFGKRKVIVSEQKTHTEKLELFTTNKQVTFNSEENKKIVLDEIESLTELDTIENVTEIIIVISPKRTSRKWYRTQKWFAEINGLSTKVIQINQ